jgi:hypothetical protein
VDGEAARVVDPDADEIPKRMIRLRKTFQFEMYFRLREAATCAGAHASY